MFCVEMKLEMSSENNEKSLTKYMSLFTVDLGSNANLLGYAERSERSHQHLMKVKRLSCRPPIDDERCTRKH